MECSLPQPSKVEPPRTRTTSCVVVCCLYCRALSNCPCACYVCVCMCVCRAESVHPPDRSHDQSLLRSSRIAWGETTSACCRMRRPPSPLNPVRGLWERCSLKYVLLTYTTKGQNSHSNEFYNYKSKPTETEVNNPLLSLRPGAVLSTAL